MNPQPNDLLLYHERLSSNKTEALFLGLTGVFLLLLAWRLRAAGLDWLAVLFGVFFVLFLFYSLNYRTLAIRLTPQGLTLRFGVFTWRVPLENILACALDELPTVMRLGGAGIHFMLVGDRYRASFNFLEYPRVVIALKRKAGPVRDISFSTRQPEEIIRLVRAMRPASPPDSA
jgi:hypothetical protein